MEQREILYRLVRIVRAAIGPPASDLHNSAWPDVIDPVVATLYRTAKGQEIGDRVREDMVAFGR